MGIYRQYGVEYSLKLKNGTIINVVPVKDVDERLLTSKYFQSRKSYYSEGLRTTWREYAVNFDCELTQDEQNKLDKLLTQYDWDVVEHCWYDVCYITTSY